MTAAVQKQLLEVSSSFSDCLTAYAVALAARQFGSKSYLARVIGGSNSIVICTYAVGIGDIFVGVGFCFVDGVGQVRDWVIIKLRQIGLLKSFRFAWVSWVSAIIIGGIIIQFCHHTAHICLHRIIKPHD